MGKSNKSTIRTLKSEASISWRVLNDKKLKVFYKKLISIRIYFLPFYLNNKPLKDLRESYQEFIEKIKEMQEFLSEYKSCKGGASLENRSIGADEEKQKPRECLKYLDNLVKIVSQDNIESTEFREKYEEFNAIASQIKYPK